MIMLKQGADEFVFDRETAEWRSATDPDTAAFLTRVGRTVEIDDYVPDRALAIARQLAEQLDLVLAAVDPPEDGSPDTVY